MSFDFLKLFQKIKEQPVLIVSKALTNREISLKELAMNWPVI
jgi:hypothetical protein